MDMNIVAAEASRRRAVLGAAHTALAVLFVAVHFLFERLVSLVLITGGALERASGLNRFVARAPLLWLAGAALSAALIGAGAIAPPASWPPLLQHAALSTVWLLLMYLLVVSHFFSAAFPALDDVDATVSARWPDRWYARHLRTPRDSLFARPLIANALVMLPLAAAVLLPDRLSAFAALSYVTMLAIAGLTHETLDHTDIHNNLFVPAKASPPLARATVHATRIFLRGVLNPLYCRIPSFYRTQHVYVHHVENNGVADVQSTLKYDRTSFFDFCHFALHCGLSFSFALDVARYLLRRRKRRPLRRLLLGTLAWFALLVAIALHNPAAALLLFAARFFSGTLVAVNAYLWHGLADAHDAGADDLSVGSINVKAGDGGAPGSLHLRHHQRMSEHWSRQYVLTPDDQQAASDRGALTLYPTASNLFLKALWARRFDLIAASVAAPGQRALDADALQRLIEQRTRACATAPPPSARRRQADAVCGRWFARYVMPGGALPPG